MKRILIWLLILAMALSFPVTVSADPATQTVYGQVLQAVDLIPGRTFTYEISIRDNLGFITGATTITWPASDFELVDIAFNMLPDYGSQTVGDNENGTYTAVFGSDTSNENTTDNGVLLTLTFKILETATSGTKAINLAFGRDEHDFIAYDPDNPNTTPSVPTAFETGSVTLTEVHQTVYGQVIDLQHLIPGDTFTYDVGIRDNFGIVTGACKLSWPISDFELIGVTFGTGMPDYNTQPISEAEDGDYIVSFGSDTMAADYTGNGTLFTLTFRIKNTATAGKKDIGMTFGVDADDFLNFGGYRMPTAFEPGSVTLQEISQTVYGATIEKGLSKGKTFTYDVSIRDNVGIVTGAVKVSWPETDFELTGITFVGMEDNDTASVDTATNGEFLVQFGDDTATTNYTDDGVLFTLTFKIADTATLGEKNIALAYGDTNDFMNLHMVTIPTIFEAGKVTLVEVTGYDITGTAASWNDTDDAVYLLYNSSVSDADIRNEWKNDTYATSANVVATGTNGSIAAQTVDNKAMKVQEFAFSEVEEGTYKLAIFKPGKYVPKVVEITISDDLTMDVVKLWLYGDVTYDGRVNGTDAQQIQRYYAGLTSRFGTGTAEEEADRLLAANVTFVRNGDSAINGTDAQQIQRYYAILTSVFDLMK
jgi:hypothetical protein